MIIGLTGNIGAGKDSVANILVNNYGFRMVSLVQPVVDALSGLFNVDKRFFTDRELKETPQKALLGRTPRELMRTLGTDWGRKLVDEDIWLKIAELRGEFEGDVVVNAVRFDNEAYYLGLLGYRGLLDISIWHIIRPNNPFEKNMSSHASDMGIDEGYIDEVLINDGLLGSLASKVHALLPEDIRSRYVPEGPRVKASTEMSIRESEYFGYSEVVPPGGKFHFETGDPNDSEE